MNWGSVPLGSCLVILTLIGSICASPAQAGEPGLPTPPVLSEKELLPYKLKGRATATGQVFLTVPSGKAVTQAGVPVYLIPTVPYTRHWFERNVRASACLVKEDGPPPETSTPPLPFADCLRASMTQLLTDKRLVPYLRTTRANPTGHFWFTKVPSGRYYIVSLLEGNLGSHKEERAEGIAWSPLELDVGEKATNLVVTDCRSNLC